MDMCVENCMTHRCAVLDPDVEVDYSIPAHEQSAGIHNQRIETGPIFS